MLLTDHLVKLRRIRALYDSTRLYSDGRKADFFDAHFETLLETAEVLAQDHEDLRFANAELAVKLAEVTSENNDMAVLIAELRDFVALKPTGVMQ